MQTMKKNPASVQQYVAKKIVNPQIIFHKNRESACERTKTRKGNRKQFSRVVAFKKLMLGLQNIQLTTTYIHPPQWFPQKPY